MDCIEVTGKQLYFAYGSNLDEEFMKKRCPSASFKAIAVYPYFELAFTRQSKRKDRLGSWVADMVFSPDKIVYGVVYELDAEDIYILDTKEVTHLVDGYLRQKIVVYDGRGEEYFVWSYFVKVKNGLGSPHPGYMEKILRGARQFQLPVTYLDFLRRIKTTEV